jgi:L,D-transpeptidase-like protein/putative Ig domain-containing protein
MSVKLPVPSLTRSLLAAAFVVLSLVPAARSDSATVSWTSPTPADQARFSVSPGKTVSFKLTASTAVVGGLVHIAPSQTLPRGVSFNSSDGVVAQAAFTWTPEVPGDYTVRFTASLVGTTTAAPPLAYAIHVKGTVAKYPLTYTMTDDRSAHWAPVIRKAIVRAQPLHSSRVVATLGTKTTDSETQNLVLILSRRDVSPTQTWYRVRLPILPNNSTGWVQAGFLGDVYRVNTHLYVDRAHFRATLKRNGKVVFKSIVGVGRSIWPTPRGEFYIRSKLTNFDDPFYGPIAFGTSARSSVLTEWPGGGFVGVHGTNQPEILPGRVSHGCIRMPNASIVKLARLMPVGTPLTIT